MTYVREQTSAELAAHMRSLQKMAGWFDPLADRLWQEVEALRAEIAGLKTGYEAYERVNAELKTEVEALRKDQPSAEVIWCACGDGYAANSYGAGFMDANSGVCWNCDAAMGRGEQP